MLTSPKLSFAILVAATISGCAHVTVTPVSTQDDASLDGLRYSLPKPFIQVTPAADGGMDADVIFLPDPDNTYVIKTCPSFLSTFTFNATVANGLLTSVTWNADTSVIGAAVAQGAGAVEQKVIDTKAADQAKQVTTVTAAQKTLSDAKLAVQVAQANLKIAVDSQADAKTIISAKQALAAAVLGRTAAQQALGVLLGQETTTNALADAADTSGGPDGGDTPNMPPNIKVTRIYGPFLYAINERSRTGDNRPTVELRAATPRHTPIPPYRSRLRRSMRRTFPKRHRDAVSGQGRKGSSLNGRDEPGQRRDQNECTLTPTKSGVQVPVIAFETALLLRADVSALDSGSYDLKVVMSFGSSSHPLKTDRTVKFVVRK